MKLKSISPVLYTNAVQETIDFYTLTLGFSCKAYNTDWGWASLEKNDVTLMLSLPNEHIPFDEPKFTGSLYFKVDDAGDLWDKVKDKVRVCYPLEAFEYGMLEFAIYDNNGYMLQFGAEVDT